MEDHAIPTICIGLDDLYSHSKLTEENSSQKHDLVSFDSRKQVNSNVVIKDILGTKNSKPKPLELPSIDFLGPADVVKAICSLKYVNSRPSFAVHKMGNTLLIDSVYPAGNEFTTQSNSGEKEEATGIFLKEKSEVQNINGLVATLTPAPSSVEIALLDSGRKSTKERDIDDIWNRRYPPIIPSKTSNELQLGSAYLPPPTYFVPFSPKPFRQVLMWQLDEMKLAVGSDLSVYRTDSHPAITIKPIDTNKEVELSSCLDLYLDNVMANVPELALCMHAKGFIRGMRILPTENIPFLAVSSAPPPNTFQMRNETSRSQNSNNSDKKKKKSSKDHTDQDTTTSSQETRPLFDPKVIDFNASTILRFLRDNCRRDDGTYMLQLSTDGETLHLYDLDALSVQKLKRWKWLLAMVSYRFAVRLGQHLDIGSLSTKVQIRHRQEMLFSSSFQLLGEIKDLGGEDHSTIRAAILEQMADVHLGHVDEYHRMKASAASVSLEEGMDVAEELRDACDLLLRSCRIIEDAILKESAVTSHDTANHSHLSVCPSTETITTVLSAQEEFIQNEFSVGKIESITKDTSTDSSINPISNPENIVEAYENDNSNMNIDSSDHSLANDGVSKSSEVLESLLSQYAGIFYKTATCCCAWSELLCNDAKTVEAIDVLGKLDDACEFWIHVRSRLTSDSGLCCPSNAWSEWRTLLEVQPVVWGSFGSLTREMTRQLQRGTSSGLHQHHESSVYNMLFVEKSASLSIDHTLQRVGMIPSTVSLPMAHNFYQILATTRMWNTLLVFLISLENPQSFNFLNTWYKQVSSVQHEGLLFPLEHFMGCLKRVLPQSDFLSLLVRSLSHSCLILQRLGFSLFSSGSNSCTSITPEIDWACCSEIHVTMPWILLSCYALTISTLLNWRASLGVQGDPAERAKGLTFSKSQRGNICIRRVAESCSLLGQRLLETASRISNILQTSRGDNNIKCARNDHHDISIDNFVLELLALAEDSLFMALEFFQVAEDINNQATVICNLCSLLRFRGNIIYEGTKKDTGSSPTQVERQQDDAFKQAIGNLNKALELSNRGHHLLGQRGGFSQRHYGDQSGSSISIASQEKIWDAVSYECGCIHLALGVMMRSHFFLPLIDTNTKLDDSTTENRFSLQILKDKKKLIQDSLTTALRVFSRLKSDKQVAATHFQLGALHTMLATSSYGHYLNMGDIVTPRGSRELALMHYGAAHGYYTRYDVGPVLILLLMDTVGIYLSAFQQYLSENEDASSTNEKQAQKKVESFDAIERMEPMVKDLLGGAYHAFSESQCAFTSSVVDRHRGKMLSLMDLVLQRIGSFLLCILKSEAKGYFLKDVLCTADSATSSLRDLKQLYKDIITHKLSSNDLNGSSKSGFSIDLSSVDPSLLAARKRIERVSTAIEMLHNNVLLKAIFDKGT